MIGLGIGGAAGDTGAYMHLGYQAAMRGLVLVAGWYLIQRNRSQNLNKLAGSGQRMPLAATLFGFGVFSVMGLSPFKGSFSKFIILYAAIERGQWLIAIAGTLATVVAAVYYMLVIQRVCLERSDRQVSLAPAPLLAMPLAFLLTALTVLISLWPAPFVEYAANYAGYPGAQGVPQFETPWALPVLVPYLGGFALYFFGRIHARLRDVAAVLLAIATAAVVVLEPGLDPTSKLFALLFAGISGLMIVYSTGYIRARHGQPLLLLRLPDDRLADRPDHGARVRQFLCLLGADDLDVLLPGRP